MKMFLTAFSLYPSVSAKNSMILVPAECIDREGIDMPTTSNHDFIVFSPRSRASVEPPSSCRLNAASPWTRPRRGLPNVLSGKQRIPGRQHSVGSTSRQHHGQHWRQRYVDPVHDSQARRSHRLPRKRLAPLPAKCDSEV